MGVASRFREAIEDSEYGSIRQFQKAVHPIAQERGVRGSSYSMVHQYLQGEATPSLEFVEVAGEVLGVRPAWLAFGEGERTRGEDQVSSQYGPMEEGAEYQITEDRDKIRDSVGLTPTSKAVIALYEKVAREVIAAAPDADNASGSDARVVSAVIQWLVEYPVVVLRGNHLSEIDPTEIEDYLIAALQALSLITPERGEGESLEALHEELGKATALTRYEEEANGPPEGQ